MSRAPGSRIIEQGPPGSVSASWQIAQAGSPVGGGGTPWPSDAVTLRRSRRASEKGRGLAASGSTPKPRGAGSTAKPCSGTDAARARAERAPASTCRRSGSKKVPGATSSAALARRCRSERDAHPSRMPAVSSSTSTKRSCCAAAAPMTTSCSTAGRCRVPSKAYWRSRAVSRSEARAAPTVERRMPKSRTVSCLCR